MEDSGSSLSPTEDELGDRFCLCFRGSVVKGHCYLKFPFKNLFAGRNKYNVRNQLHKRGIAGFGLPATCSLVSTWVCLGGLLELGVKIQREAVEGGAVLLSAAVVFGSCPLPNYFALD